MWVGVGRCVWAASERASLNPSRLPQRLGVSERFINWIRPNNLLIKQCVRLTATAATTAASSAFCSSARLLSLPYMCALSTARREVWQKHLGGLGLARTTLSADHDALVDNHLATLTAAAAAAAPASASACASAAGAELRRRLLFRSDEQLLVCELGERIRVGPRRIKVMACESDR